MGIEYSILVLSPRNPLYSSLLIHPFIPLFSPKRLNMIIFMCLLRRGIVELKMTRVSSPLWEAGDTTLVFSIFGPK